MAKYHINRNTGNPNKCSARPGNCPFGGESEHYEDRAQALEAYEKEMALDGGKPLKKSGTAGYAEAATGALVELSDGTRLVKVADNRWETSQHGGRILTDKELSAINRELLKAEALARPKVKLSTLRHAAHEEGYQGRKYFLLYNHRDPEALAEYADKAQDKEFIASIQKLNTLDRRIEAREEFLKLGELDPNLQDETRAELKELREEKKAEEAVALEMSRPYAKQLAIHRRSLEALERMAKEGVRDKPVGYQARLAKLESFQKGIKPIAPVADELAKGTPESIHAAAVLYGKPLYIKHAEEFRAASTEAAQLAAKQTELRRVRATLTDSEVARQALGEALYFGEAKNLRAAARVAIAKEKLGLFTDDIALRSHQESEVARELKALRTITS